MISPQDNSRTIGAGSILVEKNTLLPGSLALESGLTKSGWVQFANNPDRDQLGNKLAAAGWTFFLMAGAIKTISFGFERPRMIQAALKRLIATVRLQNCNCVEIDTIAAHSFLGMPYLSLSGHSRHIQNGLVFGNQTGTAK